MGYAARLVSFFEFHQSAPLTVAFALAAGMLGQTVAHHLRLPGIVALLVLGVAFGPDGANLVQPALLGDGLASLVGFAVAVILFEGGMSLDLRRLKRSGRAIRRLVTVGALVSMVLGQMVMVLVMVITSLHMRGHNHDLSDISAVIASHTFGMYAFSIISGRLADKWGRGTVILIGSATLVISCIAATISPDVLPLGVALFLLGLGWNFCFVGGSTLLADQLSPAERARTQGFNDLMVGLASALGSLESGFIFASLGYNMMAYVSAVAAFIPLIVVIVWMMRKPAQPQPLG